MDIRTSERLVIYCFFDEDGIVDRYVLHFLEGLKEISDDLLFVVNGTLTPASEEEVLKVAQEVFYRENSGYDAWAYRDAFYHIGWDRMRNYKEVVYCNSTTFGPVIPFKEMFDKMAENPELDFWGITFHPDLDKPNSINPYGYTPKHIQHYFVVYRQKFLKAPELEQYWEKLPEINSYKEAVGLHETVFTKYFEDRGFVWDSYVRYSEKEETSQYLLLFEPLKAILKYRAPVIKRRVFFLKESIVLTNTIGERVSQLLEYLEQSRTYDTDLIYENIIRTCDQSDFIDAFNYRFVLPQKLRISDKDNAAKAALVLICTQESSDSDEIAELAQRMPEGSGVFMIDRQEGEQASILGCAGQISEIAERYDYICVWNDIKETEKKYCTSKRSMKEVQKQSLMASTEFIRNVIDTFEQHKHLGLLVPILPMTNEYRFYWADRWQGTYPDVKEMKDRLGIHCVTDRESYPAVPECSCFWARSAVLKKILTVGRKADGEKDSERTLKRIYPLVAQNEGFSPGYITTDMLAGRQMAALSTLTVEFGKAYRLLKNLEIKEKSDPLEASTCQID